MKEQYVVMRDRLIKELYEIEQDANIIKAFNKNLSNGSDETNYDEWLKGSIKFAKDNETLLKVLV